MQNPAFWVCFECKRCAKIVSKKWFFDVDIIKKYLWLILATCTIRVITKLPNSEQSYKGKVKTHNYINRQNQSTTGKLWKP